MKVAPPKVKDAVARAKSAGTYAAVFEKLAQFTPSSGSWDEFVLTITQERSVEHGTIHRSILGKGHARTHIHTETHTQLTNANRKSQVYVYEQAKSTTTYIITHNVQLHKSTCQRAHESILTHHAHVYTYLHMCI